MNIPLPRSKGAMIRSGIALACLALVGYYGFQYLSNRVAIQSRLNGHILAIPAQIDGVLTSSPPVRGTEVRKGELLAVIENIRADSRTLADLDQQIGVAARRAQALSDLTAELEALQADLAARASEHRTFQVKRLEALSAELAAQRKGALERMTDARSALRRAGLLLADGHIAPARHERLNHDFLSLKAEVEGIEARIKRNQADLEAARNGFSFAESYADVPYTRQRIDEVRLRLAATASERAELATKQSMLDLQRRIEQERLAHMRRQELVAPFDGVVWDIGASAGAEIVRGTNVIGVIDCSRIFVEATVYERFLDRIEVGQTAEVELFGSSEKRKARVRALLGSTANMDDGMRAVTAMRKNPGEAKVILDFEGGDFTADRAKLCDVGRTAEVTFLNDGAPERGRRLATAREAGAP